MKNSVITFEDEFARVATHQSLVPEQIWQSGVDAIHFWTRSSPATIAPRVFLSAGIHGDEPCGSEALLRFLKLHTLSTACDWVIAPLLNPSGMALGKRENRDGIDLNRDFFRKESEEIRAFTSWWECQGRGCDFHFSLHEDWETNGFYLYEINTSSIASFAGNILNSLHKIVPLEERGPIDGHELSAPGLINHDPEPDEEFGWPEAIWMAKRYPLASLTLEAPGRCTPGFRTSALLTALTSAVIDVEAMVLDAWK
jgi:murein peptide amidase A